MPTNKNKTAKPKPAKIRKNGKPDNMIGLNALTDKAVVNVNGGARVFTQPSVLYVQAPSAPVLLPGAGLTNTQLTANNPSVVLSDNAPSGMQVNEPAVVNLPNHALFSTDAPVNPSVALGALPGTLTHTVPIEGVIPDNPGVTVNAATTPVKDNTTLYIIIAIILLIAGYMYYKSRKK